MEPSKLVQVENGMKNSNIHILELSEVRWPDHREQRCAMGNTLLYFGKLPKEDRRNRVGLLLSPLVKKSPSNWEPVSDVSISIIVTRFKTKIQNLVVIQCYIPTELSKLVEKEAFYNLT